MRKFKCYTHRDFNYPDPIQASTYVELLNLLEEENKLEKENYEKEKRKNDHFHECA